MKGKIIKYFSFRGFGFINPENSKEEIFFHVSNFPELVPPEIGNEVEFEINETPKGKEATNIQLQSESPASEPDEDESPASEPDEDESPASEPDEDESPASEPTESESPEASTLEIGELKGVGKATEEKLRAAGFDTIESLVSVDAETISEKTGISSKVTAKLIASAKELLE